MTVSVSCSRCGGAVRAPGLMSSEWRCDVDGSVLPLHVVPRTSAETVELVRTSVDVPVALPWPQPPGWTLTGLGWVGDERHGAPAAVVALSGPGPLGGPADMLIVTEEPGVGLGARYAGLEGLDPGPVLLDELSTTTPQAKVEFAGRPVPLWSIPASDDRCVFVGESGGGWLWVVSWPSDAGYFLAEEPVLCDAREGVPEGLVFGAPSPYLV